MPAIEAARLQPAAPAAVLAPAAGTQRVQQLGGVQEAEDEVGQAHGVLGDDALQSVSGGEGQRLGGRRRALAVPTTQRLQRPSMRWAGRPAPGKLAALRSRGRRLASGTRMTQESGASSAASVTVMSGITRSLLPLQGGKGQGAGGRAVQPLASMGKGQERAGSRHQQSAFEPVRTR